MRNFYILFFVATSLILSSCGEKTESLQTIVESGDMESIRSKKKELSDQHKSLSAEIAILDSAINAGTVNANLPLITTVKVKSSEFKHYVELQGDVTTDQNVLIYPEVAGTIVNMHVSEGQKVSKGQLLATIDNGGLGSQLAQMKTQMQLSKTTYERQQKLWDQKIGSEIQYLQAKANYEAQKSAVDQMERQLDKFRIRAPFGGIVDNIIKDEGTVVAPAGPGSEVFRIINLSKMYVQVLAPESYITTVIPGKEAKVFFPVLNQTIVTTVKETGNYINPANRSFTAKVPVPNEAGNVKPNLTARVKINDYTKKGAILLPQGVISENADGDQYVYVVTNISKENTAIATRKIIQTGLTQDGNVEVTKGLSSGESVIVEGARSVKDGQEVKILKK